MTTPNPQHSDPNATTDRFSGIYPNNTYPLDAGNLDAEQEQRKQARDESTLTRRVSSDAPRAAHPPLTERFTTNDHATRTANVAPGPVT